MELPQAYLARMRAMLGEEGCMAYLEETARPPRRALRVNTLKIAPESLSGLLPGLLTPIGESPAGFFVPESFAPGRDARHAAGLYYMQEPSAQLPAEALGAESGMRVLDLCAAPGGKSTQLAAQMENGGLLVCNELSVARAQTLVGNIERMGVTNAVAVSMRPDALAGSLPAFFDAILVDAPCSGEGMFRREVAAVRDWSLQLVEACARRQREILASAAVMLKGGGRLVYSTCTFAPEEDEGNVDWFLSTHPDFSLVRMEKRFPHAGAGEGQFFALFSRAQSQQAVSPGEAVAAPKRPASARASAREARTAADAFRRFWEESMRAAYPQNVLFLPDGRVLLPPQETPPAMERLRVLRAGVLAGEVREGRFLPAHALFLAYPAQSYAQCAELSGREAAAFLAGETLPCEAALSGWCAACFCGFPIGFGKAVGGTLKNHLPKGLRIRG